MDIPEGLCYHENMCAEITSGEDSQELVGKLADGVNLNELRDRIVSIEDRSDTLFQRLRVTFDNGYGMSIIRGLYSYGGTEGKFEIAVLGADGDMDYSTPIADDVIGHLAAEDVVSIAHELVALEPVRSLLTSKASPVIIEGEQST